MNERWWPGSEPSEQYQQQGGLEQVQRKSTAIVADQLGATIIHVAAPGS